MLGKTLRYVLNINTIWGFMILVAFGLCLAQHYLPTTTVLPAAMLGEGATALTIRVADLKGHVQSYGYTLTGEAGGLVITPAEREASQGPGGPAGGGTGLTGGAAHDAAAPWFVSAKAINGHYVLKWDTRTAGEYSVAVGGRELAAGKLVTLETLTTAAFDFAKIGFDIALGLVATMVLFLGLMRVGEAAGIVQLIARGLHPVLRLLFPGVPREHPASGAIVMNFATTILGLGNAATPFGLKAMKELQSLNPRPEVATDAQVMLLAYNTAGFAILPTTLLAVRKAAGCSDPFEVIGTCMIAGLVSTVVAISAARLLGTLPMFSRRTAVAEAEREERARVAASTGDAESEKGAAGGGPAHAPQARIAGGQSQHETPAGAGVRKGGA